MIFTGAIVFGIVTFTRNVSAGFIFVIILLVLQGFLVSFGQEQENRLISALLDPFGDMALDYYTRYWTVAEQNELYIPIKEIVVYNRLIWMSIASFIFAGIYKLFSFSQNAFSFSFGKKNSTRFIKSNFGGITKISLPNVNLSFSKRLKLSLLWKLSNVDFCI